MVGVYEVLASRTPSSLVLLRSIIYDLHLGCKRHLEHLNRLGLNRLQNVIESLDINTMFPEKDKKIMG